METGTPAWGHYRSLGVSQCSEMMDCGVTVEMEKSRYEIYFGGKLGIRDKVPTKLKVFSLHPHLHLALTSISIYIALMATLVPCLEMSSGPFSASALWSVLEIGCETKGQTREPREPRVLGSGR